MHWIVDTTISRNSNGRGEAGFDGLLSALQKTNTPYDLVKAVPMSDRIISADWDTFSPEEPPELVLEINGPVFATGIMSLKAVCAKQGWTPGYIDAPGQVELIEHWGEHVLNHDAVIGRFEDIEPPSSSFFARPVEDTKAFAGTVYDFNRHGSGREQWRAWREKVLAGQDGFTTIRPDDLVVLAPLKTIFAEYRLFVVGGKIVTGSRYRLGGKVFYTEDLDPQMLDFAKERLAEYCPRRAICLDIAHIAGNSPYKVIETNSISSSGFYACDMGKFVNAINEEFSNEV